jgi:hypothetical protein
MSCSVRNASNVLTEDQWKWLSTRWFFILLKEKKQWLYRNIRSYSFHIIWLLMVTNFLLCWSLILLHQVRNGFFLTCPHIFPISAGFQLTLFLWSGAGWAPHPPLSVDWFQEALDPRNPLFICRAHVLLHVCVDCCIHVDFACPCQCWIFLVDDACLYRCYMSMSMLCVHVNAACSCWCCMW